jgi:hypothetical protein
MPANSEDPFAVPVSVEPDLDDDDFGRRGASSPVSADERLWSPNPHTLEADVLEPACPAYSGYAVDPIFGTIVTFA